MMNDEWLEKQNAIIQQSIRDAELEQEKTQNSTPIYEANI